ncbi:MAG: hypothetical protein GX567_12750 [Clostridia bacterium]|nr:hypothetical protein [Clostridia bacterium]
MKTLIIVIFNILGIAISFLTKYNTRREQDKTFSLKFWINDNWPELAVIALFDAAIVGLLLLGDIQINVTEFIPEWIAVVGNNAVSFILGLGLAAGIYSIFKKKVAYTRETGN